MAKFRTKLAQQVVEVGDVTLEDFVADGEMEPSPQGASDRLSDLIAEAVSSLTSLQLVKLIEQDDSADILHLVPDWFQAKYGCDGSTALLALGISSLTSAVYDITLEDGSSEPDDTVSLEVTVVLVTRDAVHAVRLA